MTCTFVDAGTAAEVVTLADITAARGVAGAVAKHTPVVSSVALSSDFGQPVVLKAESLQRTGSFKIRGAMNKLASLGSRRQGGRHGRQRRQPRPGAGVRRQVLRRAVRDLRAGRGADHQDRGVPQLRGDRDRGRRLARRGDRRGPRARRRDGKAFCHPYDDPAVVAGQGTLGLELVEDLDDLSCVVVPLGGGGLASGVAIAVKSLMPHVRVIGVQAAVCCPYAGGASPTGPVATLADGIAVKQPGRAHPTARRASGSTTSSPSTRTPSPTPWCC